MEDQDFLKALGVLAAFIGLLLSAAKYRQDIRENIRKSMLNDIEILKSLRKESFHYERVSAHLNKSILRAYPPHEIYSLWRGIIGLFMYVGFGVFGTFLVFEKNWWAAASFFMAVMGFEMQRRSLLPGFKDKAPKIQLSEPKHINGFKIRSLRQLGTR